jgi:hypothetical protein
MVVEGCAYGWRAGVEREFLSLFFSFLFFSFLFFSFLGGSKQGRTTLLCESAPSWLAGWGLWHAWWLGVDENAFFIEEFQNFRISDGLASDDQIEEVF